MIIDSSVWIEVFRSGPLASTCEPYLQKNKIKVPTVVIFEVYKKIKTSVSEEVALQTVATLSQYQVLEFDRETALLAADLSVEFQIAMADSMVLAHARTQGEELVTLDNDFAKVPGVVVVRSK